MVDLRLTFPASAECLGRARAAVVGYAARFVDEQTLSGVALATAEAGAELVEHAAPGSALVVEVQRVGGDLMVVLRRSGGTATSGRGLGARLLEALADRVERSGRPDGAEIALTFRTRSQEREPRSRSRGATSHS